MKRMLINATQPEELRVAVVDVATNKLIDLILERPTQETKTGNIYLGSISSLEKSIEAAFVDFGSERHGFLPFKEIITEYGQPSEQGNAPSQPPLTIGQPLMVQVDKEERGNKGAALTTFISLAGSYLVLMPNNPKAGGISRRIEGTERDQLRESIGSLVIPDNMGVIIRTAGVGKSTEELQWDLDILLKHWQAIKEAAGHRSPPFLIHQESDVFIRTLRDYFREDVNEVVVDNPDIFAKTCSYLQTLRSDYADRVKLHQQTTPIFNYYQIEHQIETAYLRELRLPSGGSIVIDRTEALVSIDINSARATRGSNIEETALNTNIEAAEEIARQLRLRDLGGLIVIDFIDMNSVRNQREVENKLREALKLDRARVQIGRISPLFGLLEMSRQRLRRSLSETTQEICPRCSGRGTIRGVESLALAILRVIEEEAMKPRTAQVQAQLPIDVATYLLNEKRDLIISLEQRHQPTTILIIPNQYLQTPSYRIRRIQGAGTPDNRASYQFMSGPETDKVMLKTPQVKPEIEEPAVKSIMPSTPSPTPKEQPGLIKRIWSSMFGSTDKKTTTTKSITPTRAKRPLPTTNKAQATQRHTSNTGSKRPPNSNNNRRRQTSARHKQHQTRNNQQSSVSTNRNADLHDNKKSTTAAQQSKIKEVRLTTQPPPHLPPFPDDLEAYYQHTNKAERTSASRSERNQSPSTSAPPSSIPEINKAASNEPPATKPATNKQTPAAASDLKSEHSVLGTKSALEQEIPLTQIETKTKSSIKQNTPVQQPPEDNEKRD